MWKALTLSLVLVLSSIASTWAQSSTDNEPLFMPEDIDSRLWIRENFTPYKIEVVSPYNYASRRDSEWQQLIKLASWGCGLFDRPRLAYISYGANNVQCDEMGAVAAERDNSCVHFHTFACLEEQVE